MDTPTRSARSSGLRATMGGVRLNWLRLVNVKSFADSEKIDLAQVNVFLGPNNAGKSTVLRGVRFLQDGNDHRPEDIRLGASLLEVHADIAGPGLDKLVGMPTSGIELKVYWQGSGHGWGLESVGRDGGRLSHGLFPPTEPDNLTYQYLSKRKVSAFDQTVNLGSTTTVSSDLRHIVSKVARLANPATPAHAEYMTMCQQVLGFPVTEFASSQGQKAGRVVSNFDAIALEDMGEGVASLVGLIVDLCVAEGKVFLVEEPENDLHPKALKALLEFMARKAETNQFLVSTHSNVVARHLGALPGARLFRVDQVPEDPMATSNVRELGTDPSARIEALADLGYELYDFDLFDGWLILEESSAERIIRDYLIPWFVPRLTRVRTLSAGGASKVPPTFEDFNRLFLFTHLEARYRNRAYVVVDGDGAGAAVVSGLRERFGGWDADCFITLEAEDFEFYYPEAFQDRVKSVLETLDRQQQRTQKTVLLDELIDWIEEDRDRAREAFSRSAKEVVELLARIDTKLFG